MAKVFLKPVERPAIFVDLDKLVAHSRGEVVTLDFPLEPGINAYIAEVEGAESGHLMDGGTLLFVPNRKPEQLFPSRCGG